MRISISLILIMFSCIAIGQNQLEVGLKSGDVLYPKSIVFKDPLFKRPHLLLNGEDKVLMDSVTYYQTAKDYYKIASINKGIRSFNNAKLRKVADGAIDAYEHKYTVTSTTGGGVNQVPMTTTRTVIDYYHYDNGHFEMIDDKLLLSLVGDDAKSMKTLNKKKKQKLVNAGIYTVGGTLILIGSINWLTSAADDANMSSSSDASMNLSPTIFIGAAIMWIPWIMKQARSHKFSTLSIIHDYNSRH